MMIRGASLIAVLALSRLATLFADEAQPAEKLWLRSASVDRGVRRRWGPATAALATLALMVSACASMSANQRRHIFQDVPVTIDANARYLFHMHGSIVEDQGPNAQGRYGQYRYYPTLEALADRGFVVISEVRSRTQILTYATTVASQVAKLRAAGVPASHITVTGISKGGEITVLTTAAIGDPAGIIVGCTRASRPPSDALAIARSLMR